MNAVVRAPRLTISVAAMSLVAVPAIAFAAPHAFAAGLTIKPHQYFIGLVNGSTGRPEPVTIRMRCFGPIVPGETGHPMAGQTLAVRHVAPSANAGMTGADTTSIGVFFGTLPPASAGASSSWVDFMRYGRQPLPTSLTLPCGGTENVNFIPLPLTPSRLYAVPVSFVGQP